MIPFAPAFRCRQAGQAPRLDPAAGVRAVDSAVITGKGT